MINIENPENQSLPILLGKSLGNENKDLSKKSWIQVIEIEHIIVIWMSRDRDYWNFLCGWNPMLLEGNINFIYKMN